MKNKVLISIVAIYIILLVVSFFNKNINYKLTSTLEDIAYRNNIQNVMFKFVEDKNEREINEIALKRYINQFGKLNELFKIAYIGVRSRADIKGIHGWYYYSWIRSYELRAPFMDKPFEVWIDNRTHEIFGDNFYDTLLRDNKFQHLYSEWIKKQVGIDDGNVKFEFTGVYDKPYIEFDKITTLSDDYREIFENTHNLYCNRCYISNIDNLNDMTAKVIANEIREKYLYKAVEITNIPKEKISRNIHLSTGTFKNTDKNLKFRFDLHDIISELIIQN